MIVCGNFVDDFLRFTPTLIIEISSRKTKLRDINTKYNLYELKRVKYYVMPIQKKNQLKFLNYLMENIYKKTAPSFN